MSVRLLGVIFYFLFALLGLVACAGASLAPTPTTEPTRGEEKVLNIYNWDTYIDPAILADFEEQFGITVNYETYENNEALLSAVESPNANYDIVVPTDYMVAIMRQRELLVPLRKENIPNFKNVDPAFLNSAFDPGNRYCAPYQWGTVGIGYNIEATDKEIKSWADFFDPAYAGRVALLDDARPTLGIVLLYLGYSPNTTNPAEIVQARDFLVERREEIVAFAPDTGQDLVVNGEADLVMEWSGDIFQVMEENSDIRYAIPEEGSVIWTDAACIPITATHRDEAELFINYILEPEVGAALSNFIRYATPNQAAFPMIIEADRNNPALYPSEQVRERLFFLVDLGPDTELYEQAWQEITAPAGS
ncbi:MAG: spermidine/putrescine ABC transporter substrate-binding protein [Chloroflexi bacterium]|nr:spermidine/putrescine ABC transporter substrate-binding protein [Chloroflexota bacterium]MCI0578320.1 spermidine/putrescine ABC transporter substrate-binding protein [Chloroflexota bacterium]MCI0649012.1 spermidine/putrescine ABC transporter substrate-binding protein [Chloroflexota bacterium]MCI0729447.1 spermidine/putrescine ABC transporter substrate-binding protein [Chloroflexota bacterium]